MRLRHLLACGLCLPLLVVPAFAQSSDSSQSSQSSKSTPTSVAEQTDEAPAQASTSTTNQPPLHLYNLPPEPHSLTPAQKAAEQAARVRAALTRLATEEANWNLEETSRGNSLSLKETGRKSTPAGTEITWEMVGTGFDPAMDLTLVRWPLNQRLTAVMSGIRINAQGLAVCSTNAPGPQAPIDVSKDTAPKAPSCLKTMKPGQPVTITAAAAKGEPIRVALISADRKHGGAATAIPYPIEGQDRGCKIEVILGSKDADLVLLRGSGFKQDKTYMLGTESFGKKHPLTATITPQGTFVAALTPWVPDHTEGNTVVYYQSSTCTPTVSFQWGKNTYKPE